MRPAAPVGLQCEGHAEVCAGGFDQAHQYAGAAAPVEPGGGALHHPDVRPEGGGHCRVLRGGGGAPENRARFAVEAVRAIRRRLPDLPIDCKLAVRQEEPHYGNAGVVEAELPIFVPLLEQTGVTSFHVTLANHGSLTDTIPPANHPYFRGQGCFLKYCDQVRALTKLPVCGVGGLSDPAFIADQITAGRIDCAAMSRQLIADPAWPEKVFSGREQDIHRCVRCNKACLGGMMAHQGVHCIYERKASV